MKLSTKELKKQLEKLVQTFNDAVQTQQNCKERIIAIQAVIEDREEDGNTNDSNSTDSKN